MAQHNESADGDQIYRRLRQVEGLPFSDLLKPERVQRAMAALNFTFRERIYTPIATLWIFLSQVLSSDPSCEHAVVRLLAWRRAQGLTPCSPETTSYCEARKKLPLQLLQYLTTDLARELEQKAEASWLWKGRHVKIVDGTSVTMPDTPKNQAAFPRRRNQPNGVGFPIARVVAVFSLATAAVLDAAIAPMRGKKTGETSLFRGLHGVLQLDDILLADRLFAGFRELADCRALGVDVVARQHQSRRSDFRRGRWLGTRDHIVALKRPNFSRRLFKKSDWRRLPPEMLVRELRFDVEQRGFRTRQITLVTTLLDADLYPANDIAALYRERWHCELDLRSLKSSLHMRHLRCKTPQMVRKEIWMHLLAYNLIRETAAAAARQHRVLPRQVSFMGSVQTINAFATYLPLCGNRQELWDAMLTAIATLRVGDRPNRFEPRRLKQRTVRYPFMIRSRTEERRRLCA
jgi:hypothetical protein